MMKSDLSAVCFSAPTYSKVSSRTSIFGQLLGGKTNPHVCLGFAASLTIILLMHQYGEFPWPFLAMFSDFVFIVAVEVCIYIHMETI